MLPKKSDAASFIFHKIKTLELQFGKTTKRYHSDGASKLQSPSPTETIRNQCTTLMTTSPHTSQQIALVKRRVGTIFNGVRTALSSINLRKAFWPYAALDTIDKINFLPTRRTKGELIPRSFACFPDPAANLPPGFLAEKMDHQ